VKALRWLVAASLVTIASCADPPRRGEAGPPNAPGIPVPDVAEIVCEADGSTTVQTPEVVVQPDGIHVSVISRLDEPAQLIGLGRDIEPGETDYVSTTPPGRVRVACYPFSEHDSGEEPPSRAMEVLDPGGTYVDGEVQCSGMSFGSTSDFAELPIEAGPVPLDAARSAIKGLLPGDEVAHIGYPDQRDRGVAVRRDGQVVATFSFVTFDGEEWFVAGSEGCQSSGIESS
jgi:hypothetical protein